MLKVDPYLERSTATGQGTEELLTLRCKAHSENASTVHTLLEKFLAKN